MFAFSRCSSGAEEQCDPELENEAKKNTACGMITDPTGSMLVVLYEPCDGELYSLCFLLSVVCCFEVTWEAYINFSVNGQHKPHMCLVKMCQPFRQCQCVHEDYLRLRAGSHSCSFLIVTCAQLAKKNSSEGTVIARITGFLSEILYMFPALDTCLELVTCLGSSSSFM